MNIYTKTGDKGETSLYGGTRVGKDDPQVWCYGTIDELNSILGAVNAMLPHGGIKSAIRQIQKKLFIVGAQLASDEDSQKKLETIIEESDIKLLEDIIDQYTQQAGKMTGFTIPGETTTSSLIHVARAVARRAERHMVALARDAYINPNVLAYINRLSDALYVLAKQEVLQSFIKIVASQVQVAAQGGNRESRALEADICGKMYQAACEAAEKLEVNFSLAIADDHGELVFFMRQQGAILKSVSASQNKAYTSAVMKLPSSALKDLTEPEGEFWGLLNSDSRLVPFGGGFPLMCNGELTGAIGVSGGSADQDMKIGEAVVDAYNNWMEDNVQ